MRAHRLGGGGGQEPVRPGWKEETAEVSAVKPEVTFFTYPT